MDIQTRAVLTCDLVNSTKYDTDDRIDVNQRMREFIDKWNESDNTEYLIYRGDSIQGLLRDPTQALRQALYLKSYINSIRLQNSKRSINADIRISIGLGDIDYKGATLLESDGQAFQNSGRTLDLLKKKGRTIALTTSNEIENEKWDIILALMEEVVEKWTIQSAEIIWRLIDGWDDKKIQEHFEISQSAVSQRKKHASWEAIAKTIKYYEDSFKESKHESIT